MSSCCDVESTKHVSKSTMLQHLEKPWLATNIEAANYFCENPECAIVYFDRLGGIDSQAALRTAVVLERHGPESIVCYCFGIAHAVAMAGPVARAFVVMQTKRRKEYAMVSRSHALLFALSVSCLVAFAGCATPSTTPTGESVQGGQTTLPIAFNSVWFRTDKVRLLGLAFEARGKLSVTTSSISFTHEGGVVEIPVDSVQGTTMGRLAPDITNVWVTVRYKRGADTLVAAFKSAPFVAGPGEAEIFKAIVLAARR